MTVLIFGGGISGLASSFYVKKINPNVKVILLEASNRLGGWIDSHHANTGTLYELGPRTLRTVGNAGANTLQLAEILHLKDKIIPITQSHVSAKKRLIKVNSKLCQLPNSITALFTKVPPFSKPLIYYLFNDLKSSKIMNTDESFYSFVQRRFNTEVAKYAVDALCRGVFAGNAKDLSVQALTKRLHLIEQKHGSVLKGFLLDTQFKEIADKNLDCGLNSLALKENWSVWSLRGGLTTLVNSLVSKLKEQNVEIITNARIKSIQCANNIVEIETNKGNFSAEKAISCLPADALKTCVKNWNYNLSTLLDKIEFVDVAVVNLEYSENIIENPAFGYLTPSCEPSRVLGVIYDSCLFPVGNKTNLTVMMGGYWFKEFFGNNRDEEYFLKVALEEVESTFKTKLKPINYKVSILRKCIPQYRVGHFETVDNIKKLLSAYPLYVAGNSYEGVGINDCIYNARKLINSIDF